MVWVCATVNWWEARCFHMQESKATRVLSKPRTKSQISHQRLHLQMELPITTLCRAEAADKESLDLRKDWAELHCGLTNR